MATKHWYCYMFVMACIFMVVPSVLSAQSISFPGFELNMKNAKSPEKIALSLQILFGMAILTMVPAIVLMVTSFTRIVVVFSFARTGLALQNMPPNQVIVALALFLTLFVMMPTCQKIYNQAYLPFKKKDITMEQFFRRSLEPARDFMFRQISDSERKVFVPFIEMSNLPWPKTSDDIPTYVLIPSFMLNELKKAFYMGAIILVPFVIIDMMVASILMSMGMIMLPPVMVSLPFKVILFVMVDGWKLLTEQLLHSFG